MKTTQYKPHNPSSSSIPFSYRASPAAAASANHSVANTACGRNTASSATDARAPNTAVHAAGTGDDDDEDDEEDEEDDKEEDDAREVEWPAGCCMPCRNARPM